MSVSLGGIPRLHGFLIHNRAEKYDEFSVVLDSKVKTTFGPKSSWPGRQASMFSSQCVSSVSAEPSRRHNPDQERAVL